MSKCLSCGHEASGSPKFCPECGGKFGATPSGRDESLVGCILSSKYRLVRELGKGGMGTVYLAEHTGLKKQVALKVLHPDLHVSEESLQRFQREGIAAGQLVHSGAIQIFDFDKDESGVLYLAMEFVEGQNLKSLIRREGGLEVPQAIDLVRQILEVLAVAHRQGIVHRDLKPDNIMVLPGEGVGRVKVLDFGLSKLIDAPLDSSLMTQTGRIMGTPLYMSPEQCSGLEVDSRSDIYAVGLILHEMLSGQPTFGGDTIPEILVKQTSESPPALGELRKGLRLPEGLEEIIEHALGKDRSRRYQEAEEMLADLDGLRLDKIARPRRGRRRRARKDGGQGVPILIGALAGTTVLAVGALAFFLLAGGAGGADRDLLLSLRAPETLDLEQARYVRHLAEARDALAGEELDVALSAAEDARSLGIDDPEVFLLRARILRARGEGDVARADLGEALLIRPDYADARAEQGWLELDGGDAGSAQVTFTAALELDPGCASAMSGESELLLRQGDVAAARSGFERAIELDPDLLHAHLALGELLLESEEFEEARDAFVSARRRAPGNRSARLGLARAYLGMERISDARRELEEALRVDPADRETRVTLATLLLSLGRSSEARDLLRDAPGSELDGEMTALLALAESQADRPAEALASLREPGAGSCDGPPGMEQLLLGQLELEEGSAERAVEALTSALELLEPGRLRSVAHVDLALAFVRLERFGEALTEARAAVQLEPDDLFILFTAGWLEMDWGDPAAALVLLERHEDLGGDDERVDEWLGRLRAGR